MNFLLAISEKIPLTFCLRLRQQPLQMENDGNPVFIAHVYEDIDWFRSGTIDWFTKFS